MAVVLGGDQDRFDHRPVGEPVGEFGGAVGGVFHGCRREMAEAATVPGELLAEFAFQHGEIGKVVTAGLLEQGEDPVGAGGADAESLDEGGELGAAEIAQIRLHGRGGGHDWPFPW